MEDKIFEDKVKEAMRIFENTSELELYNSEWENVEKAIRKILKEIK
jgi:hypothetical protein